MMVATNTTTERVIYIEYRAGKPFAVITRDQESQCQEYYDVEWCRRDKQLYFHNSGCGGYRDPIKVDASTTFWAAPDTPLEIAEGATRNKRAVGKRKFEQFLVYGFVYGLSESLCEYCPTCDDYLPSEDPDDLCEHCWWCDEMSRISKPGERCPWDCQECQEYGREVKASPPLILIAQGYGLAVDRIACLTRRILSRYHLTPESLGDLMECYEWIKGARMALQGRRYHQANRFHLFRLAAVLKLEDAERDVLLDAFGVDR